MTIKSKLVHPNDIPWKKKLPVDDIHEAGLNAVAPEDWDAVRAVDRQVGGDHYKDFKIEPIEFILANEIGYCEGNIIKYICRHAAKGGIQDIDKVIHYCELLKELKYGS